MSNPQWLQDILDSDLLSQDIKDRAVQACSEIRENRTLCDYDEEATNVGSAFLWHMVEPGSDFWWYIYTKLYVL